MGRSGQSQLGSGDGVDLKDCMSTLRTEIGKLQESLGVARVLTENVRLQDYPYKLWQNGLDAKRKLDAAISLKTLKEAKHFLSELGLDLILKESYVETYRVGSDSWWHSIYMTLKDTLDRGADLTARFVADSVFDACGFQPKPEEVTPEAGKWLVRSSWGG